MVNFPVFSHRNRSERPSGCVVASVGLASLAGVGLADLKRRSKAQGEYCWFWIWLVGGLYHPTHKNGDEWGVVYDIYS